MKTIFGPIERNFFDTSELLLLCDRLRDGVEPFKGLKKGLKRLMSFNIKGI